MTTLILINPNARLGSDSAAKNWERFGAQVLDAVTAMGELVEKVRVHWTTEADHGAAATRDFLKAGGRRIIVVGGDGTLSEVVSGLFIQGRPVTEHVPEIFVLPCGRGNDFFKVLARRRFFDVQEAWDTGLQILRAGHLRPMDVGMTQWRVGEQFQESMIPWINVASFGFPGLVVKSSKLSRSVRVRSAWAYLDAAISSLFSYRPIRFQIRVDGKELFDGPVFSGFVLGGKYNAGGICWSELADPGDEIFDVLVQEPKNLVFTLLDLRRLWSGRWEGAFRSHTGRGKVVDIIAVEAGASKSRAHPLFEIDGDLPEPANCSGARFSLVPHAVQVGVLP